MEQQKCLGSQDGKSASSPMPMIGVYIAASTLVCLLLLIIDVWRGLGRFKKHLPCRFFSINSLTLTLLGISTKLPVDLTSSMPRGIDQLSKLCGSVLITISMGFFTPALADMEGFELLGNMLSLTILVVTVVVNISVQMSTGVIFAFYFTEHILSLISMLLVLIAMWYVTFVKNWLMGSLGDHWKAVTKTFKSEEYVSTENLKEFWQLTLLSGPQISLCLMTNYVVYVCLLCIISLGILVEACVRTFFLQHLEFCRGNSDYKWSMWIVVVAQILTVIIGTLSVTYRSFYITRLAYVMRLSEAASFIGLSDSLLILSPRAKFVSVDGFKEIARTVSIQGIHYLPFSISKINLVRKLQELLQVLEKVIMYFFFGLYMMMGSMGYAVEVLLSSTAKVILSITSNSYDGSLLLTITNLQINQEVMPYLQKCANDVPHDLIQLLQNTRVSQASSFSGDSNYCLLVVLLVRVASIMTPLGQSLVDSLDEIFEVLYFIDQQSATSFDMKTKTALAKELWMSRSMSDHWFEKKILNPLKKDYPRVDMISGDEAFCLLEKFISSVSKYAGLNTGPGNERLREIVNQSMEGNTKEEISARMKQLFVDILAFLLLQFHKIMSDYIFQSSLAELEERGRTAVKLVYKLKLLLIGLAQAHGYVEDSASFDEFTYGTTDVHESNEAISSGEIRDVGV